MDVYAFVDEVMKQLEPFLQSGQIVHFDLRLGCGYIEGRGDILQPCVGSGRGKVSFDVIFDGATEHKLES